MSEEQKTKPEGEKAPEFNLYEEISREAQREISRLEAMASVADDKAIVVLCIEAVGRLKMEAKALAIDTEAKVMNALRSAQLLGSLRARAGAEALRHLQEGGLIPDGQQGAAQAPEGDGDNEAPPEGGK